MNAQKIIDEKKAFNQYQAYLAGRIDDPTGRIGNNIASRVEKISSVLGFSNVSEWLESFKENSSFFVFKNIEQIPYRDLETLYLNLKKLGKDRRDTQKAVSLIGVCLTESYGNGRLFLESYYTQRRVISQVKKEYEKRTSK